MTQDMVINLSKSYTALLQGTWLSLYVSISLDPLQCRKPDVEFIYLKINDYFLFPSSVNPFLHCLFLNFIYKSKEKNILK